MYVWEMLGVLCVSLERKIHVLEWAAAGVSMIIIRLYIIKYHLRITSHNIPDLLVILSMYLIFFLMWFMYIQ